MNTALPYYLRIPGHWAARGPQGGQAGGKDGTGKGKGAGSDKGGKGSDKEDRDIARQLDKSKGLSGANVGSNESKSLGRQISDVFGGPVGYMNNPNRPKYDTKTMGVPVNMSWSNVPFGPNYGMPNPLGYGIGFANTLGMGTGLGMAATRAMQAATGMSGGPSIGGRADGMGAFGGQGGTANGGMGGSNAINGGGMTGYNLPQGYMQQAPVTPQTPTTPPAQPTYNMLNQPSQFLSPTPGYGVEAPSYSYFGPMGQTPMLGQPKPGGLPMNSGAPIANGLGRRSTGFR